MISDTGATLTSGRHEVGDESFMSAADLHAFMDKIASARAKQEMEAMQRARRAREELAKSLAQPAELTTQELAGITQDLLIKVRAAAERGEVEIMVMRFPSGLCTDHGRAINNTDTRWPETLTGHPRQAYGLWHDRFRPLGYGLSAMIVDWPNGIPGDVGLFLTWHRK